MASNPEQFETQEVNKVSDSGDQIRQQIAQLLRNPSFRKTLDAESIQNYQEIANKKGYIDPNDTENLSRFHKFMEKEWEGYQKFKRQITGHVEQAIWDKVITEKDRTFYREKMNENVVNGKQVVTQEILEKAEHELLESLEKRREERKEYEKIAKSPFIQNGHLIVSDFKKIEIPNEKKYLDMTVPERRKWLKEVKDDLPKAEKYFEAHGGLEADEMTQDYRKLLEQARAQKIIGKNTVKKFLEGFKKADRKEKERWASEFDDQIERYQSLWKNIRKTLKGMPSLTKIESMRDRMGYGELTQKFEQFLSQESEKLTTAYEEKIREAHQQKIISRHTATAFLIDFKRKPLQEKKKYLDDFDLQMQRYQKLRTQIDQLKNKDAKEALNKMYEMSDYGYSEIQAKYHRLMGEVASKPSDEEGEDEEEMLANIYSDVTKKKFRYANEVLDYTQQKTFVERLSHYFSRKSSDKQDAISYVGNIRSARKEHEAVDQAESGLDLETDQAGISDAKVVELSPDSTSLQALEVKEMRLKRSFSKSKRTKNPTQNTFIQTKTSADRAFERSTYVDRKGKTRRVIRMGGTKEAIQAFNNESIINPEDTDLHLFGKDGSVMGEMDMSDIRIGINYLKKNLGKKRKGKVDKEAA